MDKKLVGRRREIQRFAEIDRLGEAGICVVYGRRRVGKTFLVENVFEKRNILKFEGLEGASPETQRKVFCEQMAIQLGNPTLAKLEIASWRELFIILNDYIQGRRCTVFLEELQWLANYKSELIVDLKYVWDNYWSKNANLIVVLCGSSPSFLINKVMKSKALYNRSQYEFPIDELNLSEAKDLLRDSMHPSEVLDAYLVAGGIAQYLTALQVKSSVYLSLCESSFTKGGFFSGEAERIFVSSLSHSPVYRAIIDYLASVSSASKPEILEKIGYSPGGTTTSIFQDLLATNFLGVYAPLQLGEVKRSSRYYLKDSYLRYYYKCIHPVSAAINNRDFHDNPAEALPHASYRQLLGYAFEKFCLHNHKLLARILGFNAVKYSVGPYYMVNKKSANYESGVQIDLMFERKDKVLTVCEIKHRDSPPGVEVIAAFEKKLALLPSKYDNYSIHKVLISPNGAAKSLEDRPYFDMVITLEDLFRFC